MIKYVVFILIVIIAWQGRARTDLHLIGAEAEQALTTLSPRLQALLKEATGSSRPAKNATGDFDLQSVSYGSSRTWGEKGSLFLRHGLKASGYQFSEPKK